MDEVTTMKFYKLFLTQQRNSFYTSNDHSFFLAFFVLLLFTVVRKHKKMPTRIRLAQIAHWEY